jgi:hypothetical protein
MNHVQKHARICLVLIPKVGSGELNAKMLLQT